MPNSRQHKDKAAHNRAFLATINVQDFPDWAVVVAFYTAVHLAERLRTLLPNASDQHSTTHQDRLEFVQKHHRAIHTEFHELFNASLIARYQTVASFGAQFSPGDVQKTLIDQYLVNIEQHVVHKFPAPPPPSPPPAAGAGS
jgi:hypothetical protein